MKWTREESPTGERQLVQGTCILSFAAGTYILTSAPGAYKGRRATIAFMAALYGRSAWTDDDDAWLRGVRESS